ncbi:MAG: RluA family pseudouridine synthase [Patescibacteria group bacterium]
MNTTAAITSIYEDDDILCINKPAGMVVNRSATTRLETVQDWSGTFLEKSGCFSLEKYNFQNEKNNLSYQIPDDDAYADPVTIFKERVGIAHRLDKETSGILLLAKHPAALLACMAQFKERTVEKRYTALVHGIFAQKADTISLPIDRSAYNRHRFSVSASGRSAVTKYSVDEEFSLDAEAWVQALQQQFGWKQQEAERSLRLYQGLSLISCYPKTGRTHQIRVHCSYLQHPLVADELYLGRKRAKVDRVWCPRHFLHASSLSFLHPRTNKRIELEAPVPTDLAAAVKFVKSVSLPASQNKT